MSSTTLDPRNPATLEAADEALTGARSVERAASLAVDFAREEHLAGRVSVGDLHRARRSLAKAQEATAEAEARVRLVTREAAALREAEAADRDRERGRQRREVAAEMTAMTDQFAQWLATTDGQLDGWDAAFARLISRSNALGVAGGRRPSDLGRAFGPLASGLSQMRQLFPVREEGTR